MRSATLFRSPRLQVFLALQLLAFGGCEAARIGGGPSVLAPGPFAPAPGLDDAGPDPTRPHRPGFDAGGGADRGGGGSAAPSPGAGEGGRCEQRACRSGLACIGVYSADESVTAGRFCLTRCSSLGKDPTCDGSEQCVYTNQSDSPVCFAADRPERGFAYPGVATELPGNAPTPSGPTGAGSGVNGTGSGACGTTEESRALELVNQLRATNGRPALACDVKALAAARAHGKDMCQRKYFSHYSPEGRSHMDRLRAAGAKFTNAGENITGSGPGAERAVASWNSSSGHRSVMLATAWRRAAVGLTLCGTAKSTLWVADFLD